MRNDQRPNITLKAEFAERSRQRRLASIRAKLDEADNDPRPSWSAEEVRRLFEKRFRDVSGRTQGAG